MAQDVVVNGTTYPDVETVVMTDKSGNAIPFYPDAVRYSAQTLTEAQKAQARQNIGVPEAINGERGTGILKVTTAPSGYTTAIGSYTPKYRIALSTVTSQSKVSKVMVGDVIQYSYYQYHVDYLDSSYAYISATRTSLRGAAGTTPVRGTDYWTEADQEAIVQQVITALGTPVFGRVDENNVITMTGVLADGTYSFQYEDEDGNTHPLGTYTKAPKPTYTNVLPLAIGSDGKPYNGGQGWKTDTRLNSSGAESTSSATGVEVTGFIPVKNGDVIYMKDVTMNTGNKANQTYFWLYDSNFTKLDSRYKLFSQYTGSYGIDTDLQRGYVETDDGAANGNITKIQIHNDAYITTTGGNGTIADINNAAYFRISCEEITANSIITVNEPIV